MRIIKEKNRPHNCDQGFSLIEVLVCLAILAIFCIPLFQGFRYSAYNNRQAHLVQGTTAYAQETLESVKSMRINADNPNNVADLLKELLQDSSSGSAATAKALPPDYAAAGVTSGSIYQDEKYKHLFSVIDYEQQGINIGGVLYDMSVQLNPLPYSMVDPSTGGLINTDNDAASAADANVLGITRVEDVNGMDFAVITDEIHLYDKAILSTFQGQALLQDKNLRLSEGVIHASLVKNIYININTGTSGKVEVTCDVEYSMKRFINPPYNKKSYNVYRGVFDLTEDSSSGWISGGNVYVMAKAYRDLRLVGAGYPDNHIFITTDYTADPTSGRQIQVYFIRSLYNKPTGELESDQLNFNSISINGTPYSDLNNTVINGNYLTGSKSFYGIDLHTNIKGENLQKEIRNSELDEAIKEVVGGSEPVLRSYEVTVTLTASGTNTIEALVTGTKTVR